MKIFEITSLHNIQKWKFIRIFSNIIFNRDLRFHEVVDEKQFSILVNRFNIIVEREIKDFLVKILVRLIEKFNLK